MMRMMMMSMIMNPTDSEITYIISIIPAELKLIKYICSQVLHGKLHKLKEETANKFCNLGKSQHYT